MPAFQLFLAAVALVATPAEQPDLASRAGAAVERACQAYVSAWIANDRAAVLSTLTDDAVLLPAHARAPIVGKKAIEAFWWPSDAPAAKVTAFSSTTDEADAAGDVGWCRGAFDLTFTYDGETLAQHGAYLMLLRRDAGGWRITHRMWDDALG